MLLDGVAERFLKALFQEAVQLLARRAIHRLPIPSELLPVRRT
jgi:hypothetical protein